MNDNKIMASPAAVHTVGDLVKRLGMNAPEHRILILIDGVLRPIAAVTFRVPEEKDAVSEVWLHPMEFQS